METIGDERFHRYQVWKADNFGECGDKPVGRLHDTGKSGERWFIAFISFGWVVLLVFCAREGDPGSNRYGPPPGVQTILAPPPGTLPPPPTDSQDRDILKRAVRLIAAQAAKTNDLIHKAMDAGLTADQPVAVAAKRRSGLKAVRPNLR